MFVITKRVGNRRIRLIATVALSRLILGIVATVMSQVIGLALSLNWSFAAQPNIVLVVADDLGYGDLRCYGSRFAITPNLDRFAAEGVRLTSCYAGHPNCSPSRAALMTGRTPMRAGIRSAIPLDSPMHLRRSEWTVARLLKDAGYSTAHVGKWHLNGLFNQSDQPQPDAHGFEHWFSTQNNALPNHRDPVNFVRNGNAVGKLEGYAGQIVVHEAIRWLDAGRDPSKPFFLYTCFHEPHEPISTDSKFTSNFPSDDPSFTAFYGNISQMDDAFGRLMRALDERGLRNNTLVWFTSDNGPALTAIHPHGSAGPLRDKKNSLWEGGIRVPGIIRWPEKAKAGMITDEPVSGVDFLPTVCAAADIALPPNRSFDGTDILPVLEGRSIERSKPLYWQFNGSLGEPKVALRQGDWKLLATLDPSSPRLRNLNELSEREIKTAELDRFMLYNLRDDIGEQHDLARQEPDKLQALRTQMEVIYREVREETPLWPHWTASNRESELIEWPEYYRKPATK
jgi:arylsulfatase A